MAKIAVGTIPEKISYVYSAPLEVYTGCYWDIDQYTQTGDTVTVYPTYPVGSDLEKDLEKAKQWAEGKRTQWDLKQKKHVISTDSVSVETFDNGEIKDVKVLSMEHRGNGGRAYKILVDGKYYVDLREDVLLDIMLKTGISPGGILGGTFTWAKLGNQLRIVRIGSELHSLIEDSNKKKSYPKIGKKDLKVGGIYQSRKGERGVFLGYVNSMSYLDKNDGFTFARVPIKKQMLFFEPFHDSDVQSELDRSGRHMKDMRWFFKIMKSHTFIEKIGEVKIDKDYVDIVRQFSIKEIKDDILEFTGHKAPEHAFAKMHKSTLISNVCYNSIKLNLSRYGEPLQEPFEIKKFLLFS